VLLNGAFPGKLSRYDDGLKVITPTCRVPHVYAASWERLLDLGADLLSGHSNRLIAHSKRCGKARRARVKNKETARALREASLEFRSGGVLLSHAATA
jgi:hypothetical protein